jgi:hypothetical protein
MFAVLVLIAYLGCGQRPINARSCFTSPATAGTYPAVLTCGDMPFKPKTGVAAAAYMVGWGLVWNSVTPIFPESTKKLIAIEYASVGVLLFLFWLRQKKGTSMTLLWLVGLGAFFGAIAGLIVWCLYAFAERPTQAVNASPQPTTSTNDPTPTAKAPSMPPIATDESTGKVYLSDPTPESIRKTIENSVPLSRDLVAQQFIGAPVSWDGRLHDSSVTSGTTTVYMKYGLKDDHGIEVYLVYFKVELPKHNFLLQMKTGSPIHVDGVIESLGVVHSIKIKDVKIRLLEPDK